MDRLDTVVAGLSCREVLMRLNDFLDGELDALERARVQGHLAECRNCERFGGRVGAVLSALRDGMSGVAPPPPAILARLAERLAVETP